MRVAVYEPAACGRWNEFVARSKNGTFLFHRDYMDYHADRFRDYSLIVSDEGGRVLALLPAERRDDVVRSHGGLTYGGFVTDETMSAAEMLFLFDAVVEWLRADGVTAFVYKTIPRVYHRLPADEDLYALFRRGAVLYRRDVLSVIDYGARVGPQERRRRAVKKAARAGVEVAKTGDYAAFWTILSANLRERYGVAPVHAVHEITRLAACFPDAIHLYGGFADGAMLAGAVVYVTPRVAHVQYNAASPAGKARGALDAVLAHLVDDWAHRVRYFDFGISTEADGHVLNEGLVGYKEGFGARAVVHDAYRLELGGAAATAEPEVR